jgi:hypothetical protein
MKYTHLMFTGVHIGWSRRSLDQRVCTGVAMDMPRFLGLAALMLAAAFLAMDWYLRSEPLKADPRVPAFQSVDADSAAR